MGPRPVTVLSFSRWPMYVTSCEFQKTVTSPFRFMRLSSPSSELVCLVPVSTVFWFLVCTNRSMFRRRLRNDHFLGALMPEISCRIWPMQCFEMPTVSTGAPLIGGFPIWDRGLLSHYPPWWLFSWQLGVACQKPTCEHVLNQFLTLTIEGSKRKDPSASKCSLTSLRDFLSKNKNRITDQCCSFSIYKTKQNYVSDWLKSWQ